MKKVTRYCWFAGCMMLAMIGGCLYGILPKVPKEASIIRNFHDHRAEFEKIRDMLFADTNVEVVANWGVRCQGCPTVSKTVISDSRYQDYLSLLKKAGGQIAGRSEGEPAQVDISVWGSGFGGDTRHINISWHPDLPTNRTDSLDEHFKKREGRPVFQHLDQNWYIWADW